MADDKSPNLGGAPDSGGRNQAYGQVIPAPRALPEEFFPGAKRAKPKTPIPGGGGLLRRRWKAPDGTIYEWDYQHGKVEKYDSKGRHLGEFDLSGKQTKEPDDKRTVEP